MQRHGTVGGQRWGVGLGVGLRGIAAAVMMAASGVAQAQWTVTVLHPNSAGIVESRATGLSAQNGLMQQSGTAGTATGTKAVVWTGSAGSLVDLSPVQGSSMVHAAGGSQQGGSVIAPGFQLAALWSGTAGSRISLHPNLTWASSSVTGMSAAQQVGSFGVFFGDPPTACLWNGSAASFVDLGPVGASASSASATNGTQQAGYATFGGVVQAGVWSGTAASWESLHPAGASQSVVYGIDGGVQLGSAVFSGVERAGMWIGSAGSWTLLDVSGSSGASRVVDGAEGKQVGYRTVNGERWAWIWYGSAGNGEPLHPMGMQVPNTYLRSEANAIATDATTIYVVGSAFNEQLQRWEAILWTHPRDVVLCDNIDFNLDGSMFDPQDIDAFLSVYSEGPCVPATAQCNDIDFNNDGSVFDPCDIASFLTVYAEGPCAACGG